MSFPHIDTDVWLREIGFDYFAGISLNLGPVPEELLRELESDKLDQAVVTRTHLSLDVSKESEAQRGRGLPPKMIPPAMSVPRPSRPLPTIPREDVEQNVVGLISRHRLTELLEQGVDLAEDDPGICRTHVIAGLDEEVFTGLDDILGMMADRDTVIVVDQDLSPEHVCHLIFGFLRPSHLNAPAIRAGIYSLLADLEMRLAIAVRRGFTDPWDWIQCLAEDSQARILGYWELSKRRGAEAAGPVMGATLADLLRVVARDKPIREALGYHSRNAFEQATGRVPDIRNQVMHPVRPLITDSESCRRLLEALTEVLRLTNQMNDMMK